MTRNDLTAEISRLESATPSRVAAFNESRAARLTDLRAKLAVMPVDVEPFDADAEAQIARFDASTPANRAKARWT